MGRSPDERGSDARMVNSGGRGRPGSGLTTQGRFWLLAEPELEYGEEG